MRDEYRNRIYDAYVSRGSSGALRFDRPSAQRRARYLKPLLGAWLPDSSEATIVDLACGSGAVLFALRSYGFTNLRGVDVSAEQVAVAQQELGDLVEQGDVFGFLAGLEKAGSDLLLAMDVVEHLSKEEVLPFLDACYAALKPGGRLVLQTPNADSPYALGVRYGDFTHELAFTPESLTSVLRAASFAGVETRECGPRPMGLLGVTRTILWKLMRAGLRFRNLVETGSRGSGIHTRVFLACGTR